MRRRIVLVAGAATLTVAIAFVIPLGGLVRQLARDRALSAAEADAALVARVVGTADETVPSFSAIVSGGMLNERPTSLVLPDGSVVGAPLAEGENIDAALSGAGRQPIATGQAVYAPLLTEDGTAAVRVEVPQSQLEEGVLVSWIVLALLGAGLVALGVLAADRMARSIVRPVRDLAGAAEDLGGGDLARRVEPDGPKEIIAVGNQFNQLAERIGIMIELERQNAADMSHRLRTPLTALRLDIERVEHDETRDRLLQSLDEMERTVDFIIGEAKRTTREPDRCDLIDVLDDRLGFWGPLAEEEDRAVTATLAPSPIWVAIPRTDLEAAIDALIENVHAHTDRGVPYDVHVQRHPEHVSFTISDKGIGFVSKQVGTRGVSTTGSTGLGLDIVRRTAEAAGGDVKLSFAPGGGAQVQVTLPVRAR